MVDLGNYLDLKKKTVKNKIKIIVDFVQYNRQLVGMWSTRNNDKNPALNKQLFFSEQVRSLTVEKRRAKARYRITQLPTHNNA